MISREFVKYAAIGLMITLLYGALLSGFVELIGLDPVSANAVVFVLVNALSYLLQSRFVFKQPIALRAYFRFFASYIVSYAVTLAIAYAVEQAGVHYLIGFALISAAIPVISFAVLKFWVFRAQRI